MKYVLSEPYIKLEQKKDNLSFEENEKKRRDILNHLFHEDWNYNTSGNTYYGYNFLNKDIFTDNYFRISHVTVKDYCSRVINQNTEIGKELEKIIEENTEKGINDDEVIKRIVNVSNIYASTDFTISEIAENLGLSFWTVYRDITSRIKKINIDLPEGLLEKIDEKLESDKISNLKNQNGKMK